MKYLLLIPTIYSLNINAATITTSPDQLLNPVPGCVSIEATKKTVILVDQTVENKEALAAAIKGFEYKIASFYSNENREYLLNHKFEYSTIDDSGEHSAEWSVQTSKVLGNHSKKLQESLTDLHLNFENSIKKITENKKQYKSSMLLEQISSFSKNLQKCDNLVVFSDLLLVDSDGNNFEQNKFKAPVILAGSKGQITLLRVGKNGQHLKDIKKVESWWAQSLNGGVGFTSSYNLKNVQIAQTHKSLKKRIISSPMIPDSVEMDTEDKVKDIKASVEKIPLDDIKEADAVIPTAELQTSPDLGNDEPELVPNSSNTILARTQKSQIKEDNDTDEEDEFALDDFSDLGIDMNKFYREPKKEEKQEVFLQSAPVIKKEVDPSLLRLSCDEFTGRVLHEAFPACKIDLNEAKNSKIEITIKENGKISSYDNSLNIANNKQLCLSGYISGRPASSVGTDFTCRVVIQ